MPNPPNPNLPDLGTPLAALIVLVDDDEAFLAALTANLEVAGYQVAGFKDPGLALATCSTSLSADAFILDWNMPGMNGVELLGRLRDAGVVAPAMLLTSLSQPVFEEIALDQGAVDFVDKSRSPAIILKRLALILANAKPAEASLAAVPTEAALQQGDLALRVEIKRALWKGCEVALSLGEFQVVWALAGKAGTDFSYREIYDLVRGDGFFGGQGDEGYRANVRAMIKRIRKKFIEIDDGFDALENYAGFGYRWRRNG